MMRLNKKEGWILSAPPVIRNIVLFVRGFLARDRYLTEGLAALVTFGMGVTSSLTLGEMQSRVSLAGFRDMASPEFWIAVFAFPGVWCGAKLIAEGEREEGWTSLAVMSSFYALCVFSVVADLTNWGFWTLFTLLLGVMKGYALVREWTYLRWSVTLLVH